MKKPVLHSIKIKFVLMTVVISALFSVIWGGGIIREEQQHLLKNLRSSGRLMMTSLKAPIINTMILGEMGIEPGLLDSYVEEIVSNHDLPTLYAFITDEKGKVLAHSRQEEFGKAYKDSLTTAVLAGDGFQSAQIRREGEDVLDLGLPLSVAGKRWGALRIGLSMTPMENHYLKFKMRVYGFSVVIFLCCVTVFYMIGARMARPLVQLSRAMERINIGAYEMESLPPRRDEIGLLQENFEHMLARLRQSEQERREALNYLIENEKMASIGKIVAGVAHEINNPLAAISACVYKVETNIPPQSRTYWETLKAGMGRIGTIVQQLLDFSRVGHLEIQPVPSDVFFREAEAFAAMALKKYRIRFLAVDECRPPVVLQIDKGKMHQVVLNLLDNAAAASSHADDVRFTAMVTDSSYVIKVTDNGGGIPAEDREKIFDIFFTTKPAGIGSGIGLAVCKSIVDLHRGAIAVESRPGETTLTVEIPLRREVVSA